jgi:hypothetical protein
MQQEELTPQPKKQWKDYVTPEGCRIPSQKSGIRLFRDVDYPAELSIEDEGGFCRLCRLYLVGDSGILGRATRSGPVALNATEIGELVELEPRQGRRWVEKMCRLKMFYKVTANDGSFQYWVNPAYALKSGQRVTVAQFLMFRADMVKIITPYGIQQLNRFARETPLLKCNTQNAVAEAQRLVSGDEEDIDDDQEA